MDKELEKRIIDLCYKVKEIYQGPLMNIVAEYEKVGESKREKVNAMFFGRETGVIKKVSDFLLEKPKASEKEFRKFVKKLVDEAKEKTLALITKKTYDGKPVEDIVCETYDEIIECIVSEKDTLILDNKEETKEEIEAELPEQDLNKEVEETNSDNLELDEEIEEEVEPIEESTELETLNIDKMGLNDEERRIIEEALEVPDERPTIDSDLDNEETNLPQTPDDEKIDLLDELYSEFNEYREEKLKKSR
ncbi:MAG: hypothetical protein IKG27_01690 [Bacilli bacterium]|nr:hypothetical protein [Bacilli bacterium]